MINRSITHNEKGIMVSLYKTLVRLHLEYCIGAWSPHYAKDEELFKKVQRRLTISDTTISKQALDRQTNLVSGTVDM